MAYPSSLTNYTNPAGTTRVDTGIDHAALHGSINDDMEGVQTTLGTTAGTSVLKNFAAGNFPARINSSNVFQQTISGGTINSVLLGTVKVQGYLADTNGSVWIGKGEGGAAVNYINVGNANTGERPKISGGGGDTNVDLHLDAQGTGKIFMGRSYYGTVMSTAVAAGGTATLNLAQSNEWRVTFGTGNATIAVSNAVDGQKFIVSLLQDATGSRTATWFTTIRWAGGSAPTLTTTASKRDVFGFIVTGSGTYDGFIIGANV